MRIDANDRGGRTAARTDACSKSAPSSLVDQGIGKARLGESLRAQQAAVTPSARPPAGLRVVAGVRQAIVEAERHAFPDDFGFAERDERRVNVEAAAFDAGARGEAPPAVRTPPRTPGGSPDSLEQPSALTPITMSCAPSVSGPDLERQRESRIAVARRHIRRGKCRPPTRSPRSLWGSVHRTFSADPPMPRRSTSSFRGSSRRQAPERTRRAASDLGAHMTLAESIPSCCTTRILPISRSRRLCRNRVRR